MQGRLVPPEGGRFQSFPRERWRDEFAFAAAAGLDAIEWIFDAYGEDVNPLGSKAGIDEIRQLSRAHGIQIHSICADWFMDYPLIGVDSAAAALRWRQLERLMQRAAELGVTRIVVPFVDASAMRGAADMQAVATGINALFDSFDSSMVELHLETSLGPADFAMLLERIPRRTVKVNYDSGNSASLGYEPKDEFRAYGARVGSVHLKDRVRGGSTVPLGQGDTDFESLFESLSAVNYAGDFILQVARGADGDETDWARQNARVARGWMQVLSVRRS